MSTYPASCFSLPSVRSTYDADNNFISIHRPSAKHKEAIVFFSGNGLFFPNDEAVAYQALVTSNRYEWKNVASYLDSYSQLIFIRDVRKCWYWTGISSSCSSLQSLGVLIENTLLYGKYSFVGSSAGGFAAIYLAGLLAPSTVISFSGQFDLSPFVDSSNRAASSDLFSLLEENPSYSKCISNVSSIKTANSLGARIYHFYPVSSSRDMDQLSRIQSLIESGLISVFSLPSTEHAFMPKIFFLPAIINYLVQNPRCCSARLWPLVFAACLSSIFSPRLLVFPFCNWFYRKYLKGNLPVH